MPNQPWLEDATKKTSRIVRIGNVLLWKFIKWSGENISRRNFLIIVSAITGVVAGIAAMILKSFVHYLRGLVEGNDPSSENILYMILPVVGISLAVFFMRNVQKNVYDKGLSSLIFQISRKKVRIPTFETFSHMVTSGLTVGLGGSVGLEAPIIRTGSALGSYLSRTMKLGRKDQTLILACGAAAGMAAIFNSPIAGVIFAFEVLLPEMAMTAFIPLIISAASGAVVARFLFAEQIFFLITEGWEFKALPFYILLGVLAGLVSTYNIRMLAFVEGKLNSLKKTSAKIVLGGLGLGIFIFLMPPLYGEGYHAVNALLEGRYFNLADHSIFYKLSENAWFLVAFGVFLILAKIVASGLTIGAGGNGGVFASSMFSGAVLGFVFVKTVNLTGIVDLREPNFIAVGMGGILSGVMSAPLTGIFIIAEVTGGYALFVPLMIVSAISHFVTRHFESHSVYTKILAERGIWAHPDDRDANVLLKLNVSDLVETDFIATRPNHSLGVFVKAVANSRRNIFPVTDDSNVLVGIILLDDVREIMFDREKYEEVKVGDIMHDPPCTVHINEKMVSVMEKFEFYQAWNLPVVKDDKYIGFLSKSAIFNHYRDHLVN
ncbi:MAG: chloride channel protein [Saprospiraceae bacterium]